MSAAPSAWAHGRFDARGGPRQVLFGRMYEDAAIERAAFRPGGRVFCIASAGCTAMHLAEAHQVTAVDVNPAQLEYARQRAAGAPAKRGTAERVMAAARAAGPLVGWRRSVLQRFLDLDDPAEQVAFWRRHLHTRRFQLAFDGLLSLVALRTVYHRDLVSFLPPRFGAVLRGRLERGFTRHANRDNPYARALLLGDVAAGVAPGARAASIRFVHAEAAAFLASAPAGSFDGFSLSNILDGAPEDFRQRLFASVRHAAAPGATVVLRSFAEPATGRAGADGHAAADRSTLWGIVLVRAAAELA